MLSFDETNTEFCIIGDFNARSKTLNEILYVDEHVVDSSNDGIRSQFHSELLMKENNFPLERKSQDIVCNNYGKRLIELCSSTGLIIANGRCGTDEHFGKTTCDGVSLIDYVLCSPKFLVKISVFEVLPFCNMLSDKHNPVQFSFKMNNVNVSIENNDNDCMPINNDVHNKCHDTARWSNDKKESFINGLDQESIRSIEHTLDRDITSNNLSQANIDSIVFRICSVFDVSAKQCKIKRKVYDRKSKRKSQIKPWFNDKCEEKRKAFYTAKNRVRLNDSDENKVILKNLSKQYKRQLSIEHKQYFIDLNKKIKALSSTDPKAYWEILKDDLVIRIVHQIAYPASLNLVSILKNLMMAHLYQMMSKEI